jgi:glutamine kinase
MLLSGSNNKSKLLIFLKNKINIFQIPTLRCVSVNEINLFINEGIHEISKIFDNKNIAIRSSAADEDAQKSSSAGEYDSFLNVPSTNKDEVISSINSVIASYEKKRPLLSNDEIIIQEMVEETSMSGVIFTHDLNTGAPYYVINYDDKSGTTDSVTSGNSEHANRILYVHRESTDELRSKRFIELLNAVQELERVMGSKYLDIEFALGDDLTPYLLQVRPITTQSNWSKVVAHQVGETLKTTRLEVLNRFKRISGVYGKTTILGQMPDWNPVEMIGRAPRALAASIYQSIITNFAWSNAREIMGYSVPKAKPLMIMLAGQPFIDTRLSFHSFIPKQVSSTIAEKLVNHWVKLLKDSPELHDKIEFEVAITAYSFDMDKKIKNLLGDALNSKEKDEFKRAHLNHTIKLIKGENMGSIKKALDKIDSLKKKQLTSTSLQQLHDDCILLGTIPFSILARHGFIAKTILMSLKEIGIISDFDLSEIQASAHSVASEFVEDINSLNKGNLSRSIFMEKYGHLRPGTYDIMSPRYDQMKDLSSGESAFQKAKQKDFFVLSQKQKIQINNLLNECGFGDFNSDQLLHYIAEATVSREYSKFVFTRSVSDMLELIGSFAEKNNLTRNEISHVPLDNILDLIDNNVKVDIEKKLKKIANFESKKHDASVAIRLPQVLVDEAGVYVIPFQVNQPNFITNKKVTAFVISIESNTKGASLAGKIVIIEGADPGFDWIFSQRIEGLVTKYGGANSHMAIRCAEFGIPAAIGCGEQIFDSILKNKKIHLDCAAGLINPIH